LNAASLNDDPSQQTFLTAPHACRKSYAEARPETVALAKQMQGAGMSLRKISAALAAQGHVTAKGKPYVASAVQAMIGG
jgi:hypothetical protein